MKAQSGILAIATALGMISAACSSSTGSSVSGGTSSTGAAPGSGGSSNTGGHASTGGSNSASGGTLGSAGTSSTGGAGTCTASANVTPCGGSVTGTWTAQSACLNVSGSVDVQALFGLTCTSGTVTGTLQVSGTWTANADGTFTDSTMTTGTEQLNLGADCKTLSAAQVTCDRIGSVIAGGYYDTVTCVDSPSGGCTCNGTVKQSGSIGIATTSPNTNGSFTTANNAISITSDNTSYSYCVAGNQLTLTPQGSPTAMGTIVLQNGSSTGSGGAGGAGTAGGTGSGGTSSSTGGTSSSGGTTNTGGSSGSTGSAGSGGTGTRSQGPCDIYAAANMPCGAAYSMARALSSKYNGPLYQVRSGSSSTNTGTGGTTKDIGMTADGYADSAAQDAFCSGSTCTVSKLYDQSGNGNDLIRGSAGPSGNGTRSGDDDYESTANKLSVTAGGHKVYALYTNQFEGYRTPLNTTAKGVALGNKDQGIYELADGTHFGTQCCWDFGAVSPDPNKYVTMNTIFFGKGFWGSGAGAGPWFMGDFEGGVWAGGTGASTVANPQNPAMAGVNFALGILHTPVGEYALRMADVQKAPDLTTAYDGAIVSGKTWGNAGGIALGVGGDNSNNSYGTFYEGALTNGSPSNATDVLIMKNIQAVGYKK